MDLLYFNLNFETSFTSLCKKNGTLSLLNKIFLRVEFLASPFFWINYVSKFCINVVFVGFLLIIGQCCFYCIFDNNYYELSSWIPFLMWTSYLVPIFVTGSLYIFLLRVSLVHLRFLPSVHYMVECRLL